MEKEQIIRAMNMWMDAYTNNPAGFDELAVTGMAHLREQLEGKEPSYGEFAYNFMCDFLKGVK